MSGFHDVRFPDAVARGATGGPEFSTDIIAVASGFEQRNVNWSAARAKYDISTGIRTREQMAEVIAFFRARKGRAYGFRFGTGMISRRRPSRSRRRRILVWQLAKQYALDLPPISGITSPRPGPWSFA